MANSFIYTLKASITGPFAERARQQISKETTFDSDFTFSSVPTLLAWSSRKSLAKFREKQLNARGVNIKLKLKNFQTLQHSKSFKTQFILNKT